VERVTKQQRKSSSSFFDVAIEGDSQKCDTKEDHSKYGSELRIDNGANSEIERKESKRKEIRSIDEVRSVMS
jgi:hypothetical protein